ncbi:MAG: hypothetical protein ACR2I2_18915 [Bryobacteraceae bacterium]
MHAKFVRPPMDFRDKKYRNENAGRDDSHTLDFERGTFRSTTGLVPENWGRIGAGAPLPVSI